MPAQNLSVPSEFRGLLLTVAGDFNVQMTRNIDGITGPRARGQPKSEDMLARVDAILQVARQFNLVAANTFPVHRGSSSTSTTSWFPRPSQPPPMFLDRK
jgi:hypothetical protein